MENGPLMTAPVVLYEKTGRIARITLNRPEKLNAINDALPRELRHAVARANADDAVHVIVLSGRGGPSARATTSSCTPRSRAPSPTARTCPGTRWWTTPA
jgi:1,4-dihydroxy-2-naphthoyl-CoA synthase